jgi:hypothetical protein
MVSILWVSSLLPMKVISLIMCLQDLPQVRTDYCWRKNFLWKVCWFCACEGECWFSKSLLGQQPYKVVELWINKCFKNQRTIPVLVIRELMTAVPQWQEQRWISKLGLLTTNHLAWLLAQQSLLRILMCTYAHSMCRRVWKFVKHVQQCNLSQSPILIPLFKLLVTGSDKLAWDYRASSPPLPPPLLHISLASQSSHVFH